MDELESRKSQPENLHTEQNELEVDQPYEEPKPKKQYVFDPEILEYINKLLAERKEAAERDRRLQEEAERRARELEEEEQQRLLRELEQNKINRWLRLNAMLRSQLMARCR